MSIPAAFTGLYSIKPSSGRISFRGVANSVSSAYMLNSTYTHYSIVCRPASHPNHCGCVWTVSSLFTNDLPSIAESTTMDA